MSLRTYYSIVVPPLEGNPDPAEWRAFGDKEYKTRAAALRDARQHFGADQYGRIAIVGSVVVLKESEQSPGQMAAAESFSLEEAQRVWANDVNANIDFVYRVVRFEAEPEHAVPEKFAVHELGYDKDGRLKGWGYEAEGVEGKSVEEMRAVLSAMLRALDQPVLEASELKEE